MVFWDPPVSILVHSQARQTVITSVCYSDNHKLRLAFNQNATYRFQKTFFCSMIIWLFTMLKPSVSNFQVLDVLPYCLDLVPYKLHCFWAPEGTIMGSNILQWWWSERSGVQLPLRFYLRLYILIMDNSKRHLSQLWTLSIKSCININKLF